MNRSRSMLARFTVLIFLLALPMLACTTLTGTDDESSPKIEEGSSGQPTEVDSEKPANALEDAPGGEAVVAGDQQNDPETGDNEENASSEAGSGSDKSGGDPRESIISALNSGLEVDAMRLFIITEDGNSGLETQITLAFVRPDRYQMISDEAEFIIIDDTTYMSSGNGDWITIEGTDMTSTVESTLDAYAGASVISSRQDSLTEQNVNFEGKENINGVDTLVYSFDEGLSEAIISGSVKMWIGEDDGLLYKQEVVSSLNGQESRILMEFEYGSDVTIEAPQ